MTSSSSAVLDSIRATSSPTLPAPMTAMRAGLQRPLARDVGVAVEPADEVGAAVRARQVDAGDVEVAVLLGAGGEHDRVVEALEVLELEVDAVLDVAEQADLRLVEDLVQGGDDALDARVVGRDAVPDEAERGGLALEQVDADALGGRVVDFMSTSAT